MYGLASTLFSEALTYFPIAYLTLPRPILAAIDSNIEGMAFSLGASRWRVFRTVTLPLAVPGLANAFLLLFAASLADFATPLILAGNQFPVLPTQAYLQITGLFDLRGGAALTSVLLLPALAVFLLQRYWVSRRFYVTITGKGAGQTPFDSVSPVLRNALLAACATVTVVIVYFYALLLYASAAKPRVALELEGAGFHFAQRHVDGLAGRRHRDDIAGRAGGQRTGPACRTRRPCARGWPRGPDGGAQEIRHEQTLPGQAGAAVAVERQRVQHPDAALGVVARRPGSDRIADRSPPRSRGRRRFRSPSAADRRAA